MQRRDHPPDSTGNFNFSLIPANGSGITGYAIQFSRNGLNWNDPVNGAMKLSDVQGTAIPVNAGTLLLVPKNWYWRVTTNVGGGKPGTPGSRVCKFVVEPSGGAQALTAPVPVSPVCSSTIPAGTVLFDAKPGAGTFQIFRAELQYNPAVGSVLGTWHTSNLLAVVDKTNPGSKFGVAIPVQTLSKEAARWRWRARLYNEKMPLFGNSTTGTWSPWCEFTVPSRAARVQAGPGTFQQSSPPVEPSETGIRRSTTSSTATRRLPAPPQ